MSKGNEWTDQMDVPDIKHVASFSLGGGRSAQVQKTWDTDPAPPYRLTIGNLFGSQSVWMESADCVMRAIERVQNHDGGPPMNIREFEGAVYLEPRAKDDD